jgi:serine/threonine-protein kinase
VTADDRPVAAPSAGAVVGGKYRLVGRLGAGGMGEVWVAENRDTGSAVAVKMARGPTNGDDAVDRFRREARLAAKLGHRGIVRIFDLVDEPGGALLIVMELLRGETLERHLQRRGPLPPRDGLAIVTSVLAALAHAHEAGIVHRDVTPANVFLAVDPDGQVNPKVLDFGLAKVPASGEGHTVDGRALGTPRYMAPERIRDRVLIDGRSDVFSVAVILYELLTGECPFAAPSAAASLAAVLETVVDPDPRIEPRLWVELRRGLSKRPYERHDSALAMRTALLAASGETDASVHEALRALPVDRVVSPDEPTNVTQALRGQSLNRAPTSRTVRGRVVASLFVASAIAGAAGFVVASRPASPAAQAAPSVPRPAASDGEPDSSPPAPSPTSSVEASAAVAPPATPSSTPAAVRRTRPARPKPVAVTPGF